MAAALNPEPRRSQHVLLYFLALSLGVHLLFLLYLNVAKLSLGENEPPPLVVKLAQVPPAAPPAANAAKKPPASANANADAARQQPPPPPSKQIVSPSDQENQLPPLNEAYLSDRDNRVDKQTVRHGNPEAGSQSKDQTPPPEEKPSAPPPPAAAQPPPRAAPAPKEAPPKVAKPAHPAAPPKRIETASEEPGETIPRGKPLPGLDQLLAPPGEVLAKADTEQPRERPSAAREQPSGRSDPRADPHRDLVSAPPPAPGLFSGLRGTFDDLDVAQGNLTMLNTKADRFAPFVRRVGTRVFQNLLIYQRRNLGVQDILAAHEPITVRVVLDRNGKLKTIDVSDRSGSLAVDQTLIDACRQAAFDQNPPGSAANPNGEYEFIFEAQLFAGVGPGPDGPQLRSVESRLRVGLL